MDITVGELWTIAFVVGVLQIVGFFVIVRAAVRQGVRAGLEDAVPTVTRRVVGELLDLGWLEDEDE